jgi:hypothetical protein
MRKILFLLWFILPSAALAQFSIKGRILDGADKNTVPGATVFLANASVATATTADGTFTLNNVRSGQYELVVTMIGYDTYRQTILVNANMTLADLVLASKSIALNEVKIRPDPDWERNYELFREEFLGSSEYAKKCKILNPELIDIHFDKTERKLTATSSDFIVIENKALGYKVKYLLSDFTKDYRNGYTYFAGTALFEDLAGKNGQQKTWAKNRLKVYEGSSMHFLRSVIANQVPEDGFTVLRLIRKVNPDYKGIMDKQYFQTLVTTPLSEADYVKLTDTQGLYALSFKDCLYVMYSKKPVKIKPTDVTDVSLATTTLILDQDMVLFDNNGIFIDPPTVTFDGAWGKSRMAEMLPVDYEPAQ